MKGCPVCNRPLKEVPRYGVMLDICPSCRGVWLDGGELEKVIKMTHEFDDDHYGYKHDDHDYDDHDDYHYHKHDHYNDPHHRYKKKKKGFFDIFEDIFD